MKELLLDSLRDLYVNHFKIASEINTLTVVSGRAMSHVTDMYVLHGTDLEGNPKTFSFLRFEIDRLLRRWGKRKK
jgi:hypothetical protein